MAFQKGQPKPAGSGRKPGQATKRANKFYALLDGDGFSLKTEVRAAIKSGDPEWVKALAALLKSVDAGIAVPEGSSEGDDLAKLLKLAGSNPPA